MLFFFLKAAVFGSGMLYSPRRDSFFGRSPDLMLYSSIVGRKLEATSGASPRDISRNTTC